MSRVVLDSAAIDEFINGPDGLGARVLGAAAVRVESQAKLNATGGPVEGAVNAENRGPRVRTDRLRSSITWVFARDELGLHALVGTNVFYGRHLEIGFTSSTGNFYKYPFLVPALSAV